MRIGAILIGLCVGVSALMFQSCNTATPQPGAEVGWNGSERIVRVTDNSGQQFLINYLIYQQLFAAGGYNNVVHHYYSNPSGRGIYRVNTRFARGKPLADFSRSYKTAYSKRSVYRPTSTNVSRARRSATYIRAAKVYSSRPASSSYRTAKPLYSPRSYSSPSRSSYRSSYRSSFRSGRR